MTGPLPVLCLALGGLLLGACAGPAGLDGEAKMDAALRARLAGPDAAVAVLIGLAEGAPADVRAAIEADGLVVGAVAGDVVAASGPAAAVRRVARRPWVARLELSQERPPAPSNR